MINIPKGTKDVLPAESYKWQFIEERARKIASTFNFNEIRTPTFEHTELFLRSVGETTDIVNKEMYTFFDKGDRSITLKPEGTAGVARAFVENSLYANPMPVKMYYFTPVFRYEKPQAGRLREHHQFGVELYGSNTPEADFEVILLAKTFLESFNINLSLEINSIGCPVCRKGYNDALMQYFNTNLNKLCTTCKDRLDKNPLRILDCKEDFCAEVIKNAPIVIDFLCDECACHHNKLKQILTDNNVNFTQNPKIVRGLDYYTKTVFEFISLDIGAKATVCGGGRYNNLVKNIGDIEMPAVGFGMGLERLILVLEKLNLNCGNAKTPLIYIANQSPQAKDKCLSITSQLRQKNFNAECDITGRSLKAQMKYADKLCAKFVVVIGETELETGLVDLKNMQDGKVEKINLNELISFLG